MSLEQKINYQLNKIPGVKKVIKRVYQRTMYAISPKIKSEGSITRISPDDPSHEYFFGYYDKSPWDATDRYMLCMRANDAWSDASPKEKADILLIDTSLPENDKNRVKKIAETRAWNVQQSCMLQWLGPDFSSYILFNDYRGGKYVAVIKELATGKERIIPAPVYTVSADGKTALTLDFSRLYNLRPGYGYYNVEEITKGVALPDATAVWKINLESGEVSDLLTYKDFATFQPRSEMQEAGSVHKVNHLMISPSGKRCMVLYRWFNGQRKYTRLVTFNTADGTDMYVLSDDDMVSHCFWKDDEHILAFENKKDGGSGYYFMTDKTQEYIHCWSQLSNDGHPSYSPNRKLIVTDTYPDRARVAKIKLMHGDERKNDAKVIARVFAPFKYDNDTRCDLHPRWNHAGDKVCFDSVFEGHRGLYVVDISDQYKTPIKAENTDKDIGEAKTNIVEENPLISVIVPIFKTEQYLKRCVDSIIKQTYRNLEIILVDDGSPDNSDKICDELALADPRIKVIHKENGGVSSARNAGLKIATGDYVAFVDSDDWIDKNIYAQCIFTINKTGTDIVDFKPVMFFSEYEKVPTGYKGKHEELHDEEILYDYLYKGQMEACPFSVGRKIYRRELFAEIEFPIGKVNEDIATNFKVLSKAHKLVHIPDIGYFYFTGNEGSITSGILKKKDFDLLDVSKELVTLSEGCKDSKIKALAEVKLARSYFSLLAKAATGGISDDVTKDDMRFLTKNLRKNYRTLIQSQMPINRKILATAASIDYRTISVPYNAVKLVREWRIRKNQW